MENMRIVEAPLTSEEIISEHHTLTSLSSSLDTRLKALIWCAKRGLIRNTMPCSFCNAPCMLGNREASLEGKYWICSVCYKTTSVRKGSLFEGSQLKLFQIVVIMYGWCMSWSQKDIAFEAGNLSGNTLSKWVNRCRKVCKDYCDTNSESSDGLDYAASLPKRKKTEVRNETVRKWRQLVGNDNLFPHFILSVSSLYQCR